MGHTTRFSLGKGNSGISLWDNLGIEGNSGPISMKESEPPAKKLRKEKSPVRRFIQFVKEGAFSIYDGKSKPWIDGEGRSRLGFEIFTEEF
ncbi:conserved hypothetical protein [Ricinus communis]|uniref:Uncharacterized protein n=1 Tax=Ricinus communis TaxID=3988 RepID=B9RX19_RICCO|nr:conserved hypothetical protein [Ricinus communis]